MHTRRAKAWRGLAKTCGWLLLALVAASPTQGQTLPEGQATPLPVQNNRCQWMVPTSQPDDKFFLIVGSASVHGNAFRVSIQTEAVDETAIITASTISAKKAKQEVTEIT